MFELNSFAKINLGLEILGKRDDGYHNLRTIFQTVDLCDTIELRENGTGRINLTGDHPGIKWDQTNTVAGAFRVIYENYPARQGFDILVKKRIPPGSGLGGGSGNAAVVLMFIVLLSFWERLNAEVVYAWLGVASGGTVASAAVPWGLARSIFAGIAPTSPGDTQARMSEGMSSIQSNRLRKIIIVVC